MTGASERVAAWRERMRVIADAEQRRRDGVAAPVARNAVAVTRDGVAAPVARDAVAVTRDGAAVPMTGDGIVAPVARDAVAVTRDGATVPMTGDGIVALVARDAVPVTRDGVVAPAVPVTRDGGAAPVARDGVAAPVARDAVPVTGDAVTVAVARDVPVAVPVRPMATVAAPVIAAPSVMSQLATVLAHLCAGRIHESTIAWDAITTKTSSGDEYTRWLLVRDLVTVAGTISQELVVILARAIVRNALSSTHGPLVEYARVHPARAALERDTLQTNAPSIARLVGDALGARAFPTRGSAREANRSARSSGSFWMFAFLILGVCLMVAAIGVITRPRHRGEAFTRSIPRPAQPITQTVARPTAERELESRVASLYAIRRSIDILAANHWVPAAFDGLIDALVRNDCEIARGAVMRVDGSDAPEAAQAHLDSIRMRVFRLCADEKSAPVE